MGLLSRKKTEGNGGGLRKRLLSVAGVAESEDADRDDPATIARREQMKKAWLWLRCYALDRTIKEYFAHGTTENLTGYVTEPAAGRLLARLEAMREAGQVWIPPSPAERNRAEIRVIDERIAADGRTITEFTIQESFRDTSQIAFVDEGGRVIGEPQKAAEPPRRILQATVVCPGPQEFVVKEVRQVSIGG